MKFRDEGARAVTEAMEATSPLRANGLWNHGGETPSNDGLFHVNCGICVSHEDVHVILRTCAFATTLGERVTASS